MARNGRTKDIYEGTFICIQTLFLTFLLFFVGDAISLNAKDRLKTTTMIEVVRPIIRKGPSKSIR